MQLSKFELTNIIQVSFAYFLRKEFNEKDLDL